MSLHPMSILLKCCPQRVCAERMVGMFCGTREEMTMEGCVRGAFSWGGTFSDIFRPARGFNAAHAGLPLALGNANNIEKSFRCRVNCRDAPNAFCQACGIDVLHQAYT